jgi:hypothetical protein
VSRSQLADVTLFAEAVDRRHVLVRVLRQLSAVQREVLVFRYLLDATVAETAATLGERAEPGGRLQDLVITSVGLSQPAMVPLVSAGLS